MLTGIRKLELSVQDREAVRRYLLGQMTEADLPQVEERLMYDSELYEELHMLEDEIVDEYVKGEISDDDRKSFEDYFLQSSEHQEKLHFARAFHQYVDQAVDEPTSSAAGAAVEVPVGERAPAGRDRPAVGRRVWSWPFQRPAFNHAFAAVVVIAVAGIAWVGLRSLRPAGPGNVFEATL